MSDDPWSRPTLQELHAILEGIEKANDEETRLTDRLELSVPAEIITSRGNTVAAMTREISTSGVGLLHRGSLSPGEVTVRMASDSRSYEYRVEIKWCHPTENGMFLSGGVFLRNHAAKD
ncbi:MAG: PilZ domain-containing protein [Planctomycetaceae bacterium]|mgnify:CR=1 FL=1